MEILREWRALTDSAGTPALAHGNDVIIGFSPERYARMLECCEHTTEVDADRLEEELAGSSES